MMQSLGRYRQVQHGGGLQRVGSPGGDRNQRYRLIYQDSFGYAHSTVVPDSGASPGRDGPESQWPAVRSSADPRPHPQPQERQGANPGPPLNETNPGTRVFEPNPNAGTPVCRCPRPEERRLQSERDKAAQRQRLLSSGPSRQAS